MEIVVISEKSPYLEEVARLGRANADTLGFLPRGAFTKYATDNRIFVALDEEKKVIGYLLSATSAKKRRSSFSA